MNWRFTLLQRDDIATVIKQPVGWDACQITVKRDPDTHGIVFDFSGNDFLYYGEACRIIKKEYDRYGSEGNIVEVIEQNCNGKYIELCRYRLVFSKYIYTCGKTCYVKIPMETTSDVMELINKWDQKVDLYTLKGFDEVTDLVPYNKLPLQIDLPSKGIFIQDVAVDEALNSGTTVGRIELLHLTGGWDCESGIMEPGFDKIKASEIGGFDVQNEPIYDQCYTYDSGHTPDILDNVEFPLVIGSPGVNPMYFSYLVSSPIINYAKDFPNYGLANDLFLDIRQKGRFIALNRTKFDRMYFYVLRVPKDGSYEWIDIQALDYIAFGHDGNVEGLTVEYDKQYTNPHFTLNPDDRIYSGIALIHFKHIDDITAGNAAFTNEIDIESYVDAHTVSHAAVTKANVFLVNEALSRVSEAVTNDKIRVYSEYFGRTDSMPYSVANNGCGSMEAITNGLHVRRQEARNGQTPTLPVSMQDMFNGLEPIHHVGFGIENDTKRFGFKILRIEHWKYFYKSDILMSCVGVYNVDRSAVDKELYSTASFGYQKWEAEQYTGLDEFLTQRDYRTTLSTIKNDLKKLSTFIISGYAWEVTRRLGNDTSQDWRYDNDVFLSCLTRGRFYQSSAIFVTEDSLIYFPAAAAAFFSTIVGHTITVTGSNSNNVVFTITSYTTTIFGLVVIQVAEAVVDESADNVFIKDNDAVAGDQVYAIELGNVINPSNIIDPATIYNYRLTPARNAMRWMDLILSGYRTQDANSKLIFTNGQGNFIAAGEMEDANCRLENDIIVENQTLSADNFEDPMDAMPLRRAERVNYEFPMSVKDFKAILKDPYGFIYFKNNCEEGIGWIDTIQYVPEKGKATYTLIPAYGPELPPAFRIFMEQYNLVFQ